MANYWILKSSQDWIVPEYVFVVDALIVAGGGASGQWMQGGLYGWGGGGGAGGVLRVDRIPVTPGELLPAVVGAGGLHTKLNTVTATPGGNSSFKGHIAVGGGVGQTHNNTGDLNDLYPESGGGTGGSGGGGSGGGPGSVSTVRSGGGHTPGQGTEGGNGAGSLVNLPDQKPGAGGGGAAQSGESVTAESDRGGKGGDGFSLADIGWWDQELANLLNPAVDGDVDLLGHLTAPQWQSGVPYTAGDVVWITFPWRLYVCTDSHVSPESPIFFTRLFYGVGGGGGGGNGVAIENVAEAGKGGGAEGGYIASADEGHPWPAQENTGGGGVGGPGGANLDGGSGIIILRLSSLTQRSCDSVGIDQIVYEQARRAGIPKHRMDLAALAPDSEFPAVVGMGIGRPASARTACETLQNYAFFDLADIGGKLAASRRDRAPDGVIGGDDVRGHAYGETPPTQAARERDEDYEIPRIWRVKYLQAQAEYEDGNAAFDRRVTDAQGVIDIDLSAIAMEPDQAASIAEIACLETIISREQIDTTLVATEANKALKPGDIKTLEVGARTDDVRLVEMGYAYPGLISLKQVRHDPTIYSSDARGVGRALPGGLIVAPGITSFALLDAPLVREYDETPGYFAVMGGNPTIPGLVQGWPGGDLSRLESGGWEDLARILRPGSVFGATASTLAAGFYTSLDPQTLKVTVNGSLQSATLGEALAGANLAAVEVPGGWELIRFLDAEFVNGFWELSGLIRGVHGTEWAIGTHAGGRFIVLGNGEQIPTDIATELDLARVHNAANIGGAPDPATEVSFRWTGVDRKPYAPCHLAADREAGSGVTLSWTRRDRVGRELTDPVLPLSEAAESYDLDIFDGAAVVRTVTVSAPTYLYTEAQELADFGSLGSEITFSVAQNGALGRGHEAKTTLTIGGDAVAPEPPPPGAETQAIIDVAGTFDADDTLYFEILHWPNSGGVQTEVYSIDGAGKAAIGDYLVALEALVAADFPAITTSLAVGNETLTLSSTTGLVQARAGNNTAQIEATIEQEAAGVSAGVSYVAHMDLYQPGTGGDAVGPSVSTQYGQGGSMTAQLTVVGVTYDARKTLGASGQVTFQVPSSHDLGGAAASYTVPLSAAEAAIDAHAGFAAYKASVSLGLIAGMTWPPPRAGVAIELAPNYRLAQQFYQSHPTNVSASLTGFKFLVKDSRAAVPAFPSGAEQIVTIRFGDTVLGGEALPTSVVAGQVYKITLGGVAFSHTVDATDDDDPLRESIYEALGALIDADPDYVVDYTHLTRPPGSGTGEFISEMEIRHVAPDTPFTLDVQASYGIEVRVTHDTITP